MTSQEIIDLRKTLGMSQVIFAEKLGVSFATVNRWENGRHIPSPLAIEKIKSLSKTATNATFPNNNMSFRQALELVNLDYSEVMNKIKSEKNFGQL
jgi:transcriptional regulator with XRE-family HTH domain